MHDQGADLDAYAVTWALPYGVGLKSPGGRIQDASSHALAYGSLAVFHD